MRRIARTRCSTRIATTRSSGIDSSPTRPAMKAARRCRIERPGELRLRTAGGACSGRSAAETGKKPGPAVHDDLCVVIDEHGRERHRFVASRPNQLWLTDITEHKTSAGRLYLCAVKDAFSGRIVGYSIDSRMKASLAVRAVRNAVRVRGNVNDCIVHSDRGSQFRSRKLRRELAAHNLVGSMGRVASCGDCQSVSAESRKDEVVLAGAF